MTCQCYSSLDDSEILAFRSGLQPAPDLTRKRFYRFLRHPVPLGSPGTPWDTDSIGITRGAGSVTSFLENDVM